MYVREGAKEMPRPSSVVRLALNLLIYDDHGDDHAEDAQRTYIHNCCGCCSCRCRHRSNDRDDGGSGGGGDGDEKK